MGVPAPSAIPVGVVASVVICTRNRPESLVRAVTSVLADGTPAIELLIIDQSDDDASERALTAFKDDRLRYIRAAPLGKGSALNEALRLSRGELLVCTDDDCEAAAGWVAGMVQSLVDHPTAAVVFGRVAAPAYDTTCGYIPRFEPKRSRLLTGIRESCSSHGLGANMALRRHVVVTMGGFDPNVGPGSIFPSADDWDVATRAILAGWDVYIRADDAHSVLHHGYRSFAEGRSHAWRDFLALGGVTAKPLRAGYLQAAIVPVWVFWSMAFAPAVLDMVRLRRPRVSRVAAFLRGFSRGLRTPVNRTTLVFLPASRENAHTIATKSVSQ